MASQAMECLNLSEEQIKLLEESFNKVTRHPDGTTLMLIAAECGLSEEVTQVMSLVFVCHLSSTPKITNDKFMINPEG
ncbi:hypothetical protein L3Q82_005628 [Scortum barcoo]|uniref:Uncharacterized protein n=1 Tax=Scortum barcoo TaxID=214431 RepID=A0ACB8V6V4_9TELE|nr:hypothetical protein L3Q82_005628 [Scortum barcoo]